MISSLVDSISPRENTHGCCTLLGDRNIAHSIMKIPINSYFLKKEVSRATLLSKKVMKVGQGNNNSTMLNRSIKNPAQGSKRMSNAL